MVSRNKKFRLQATALLLVTGALLQSLYSFFVMDHITSSTLLPVGEAVRNFLGMRPAADPRVVVISPSVNGEEATLREPVGIEKWEKALTFLAKSPAQRVLVAEHMGAPHWKNLSLKNLGGSLVFSSRLVERDTADNASHVDRLGGVELSPVSASVLVGGPVEFAEKVSYGHLQPWDASGFVPLLKTDRRGELNWSKQLGLQAGPIVKRDGSLLRLNETNIKLGAQGPWVLPVHTGASAWEGKHLPFDEFVADPESFSDSLSNDSVVIIQESQQWPQSPGVRAEVLQIAETADRLLNNRWPRFFSGLSVYVSLLAVAFLLAVFFMKPRAFLVLSIGVLVAHIVGGPLLYASTEVILPWTEMAFVFLPACLLGGFYRLFRERQQEELLHSQFSVALTEHQIPEFAALYAEAPEESLECCVTLMDIDVIGFSKTIENTPPADTVRQITELLSDMIRIVHQHGGIVSEVSADGLLVAFGDELVRSEDSYAESNLALLHQGHVTSALMCAREIQVHSVGRIHDFNSNALPPFPVRIALNTCTARLAVLNLFGRLETQIIGAGVDLVKQLAARCEPFLILASESSLEVLKTEAGHSLENWSTPRSVQFEDSNEWLASYEFNPFNEDPQQLRHATEIFRSYNQIKREDNRFAFKKGRECSLQSDEGAFDVLDFSQTGLRLRSTHYIANGATFKLWPAEFPESEAPFRAAVTVQWGGPSTQDPDQFIIGVRYSSLAKAESQRILHYFHQRLHESMKQGGGRAS